MSPRSYVARMPVWLRRSLWLALAVWACYLLAGNLLVNTPLGETLVNRKPERFSLHWRAGLTLWPGRVTLWQVRTAGQVRQLQWSVQASRADGRIALLPLVWRELRVPWVEARDAQGGVVKVESELASPPARAGGWRLRFDRIASDSIRRGRFGDWQLEGDGRAQVAFTKQLRGGPMEILPSSFAFPAARLAQGDREWLRNAALSGRFAIARHRRDEAPGVAKLRLTDAVLEIDGEAAGMEAALYDARGPAFELVPGAGRVQGRLDYARGALRPGSRLDWNAGLRTTDAQGVRHLRSLDLRLEADRDLHLHARLPPSEAPGELDLDLTLTGNALPLRDWRQRLAGASGHVRGEWTFGSLRWLGRLFVPQPWFDLEGAGRVAADLRLVSGHLVEGSRLQVPEVDATARVLGNRIHGRARAEAGIEAGEDGTPQTRLDLVMERFDIAAEATPDRAFVTGRDLRLQLHADGDLTRVPDTLQGRLRFNDARVPDLRAYNRYLPPQMRFLGGAGALSGDLTLDAAGEVAQGHVRVRGNAAQFGMAGMRLRGDVDIDAQLRRADLQTRDLDFGGTRLALRNVSFTDAGGERRSGWWARVRVAPGHVATATPYRASGTAQVEMKDVGFLLSLFSRGKDYPKWILRLVDEGEARATGRVEWRHDGLVLDRVQAENDRFYVLARMTLQGDRRQGDLFARWGVLSLGVELQDDQRKYHLRRAREWYDSRPDLLR